MKFMFITLSLLFCIQVFSQPNLQQPNQNILEEQNEFYKIELRTYLSNEFMEYYQVCYKDSVKWDCCLLWEYNETKAQKQLFCPCNTNNQSGKTLYKQDTIVYTHRKPDFIDFMDWFVYRKTK